MRPAVLQVGGTLYWVIQTRNPDTMVLKDADSAPTVAVRKNGASVGDSVTVTKRSATTGIYDCSYNPAAEVEGDSFTFEESAAVTGTTTSSATYTQTWNARVFAVERGTDSANTTTPPTVGAIADQVWDEARSGHATAGTFGEKVNAELDPASVTAVQNGLATQSNVNNVGTAVLTVGTLIGTPSVSVSADVASILNKLDTITGEQLAAITVESGTIGNFPSTLTIGDSYDTDTGWIKIAVTDENGDPITALGSLNFDDATVSFVAFRPNDSATIAGTCEFIDGVSETYVKLTLTSVETNKGLPEYTYEGRLKFAWTGGKQKTYKTTPFKFIANP